MNPTPRLAIVGNGMAAARLLDELSQRGGLSRYRVTVFGEEPAGAYNRILLNRVLAGAETAEITLKPVEWYARHGVTFVAGRKVVALDTATRVLTLDDGSAHAFDELVLATGSVPVVPPTPGATRGRPGVVVYRTLADCDAIRPLTGPGRTAVVVGGGLLGLEAARAIADLGGTATVVHRDPVLMNAQLDRPAGAMLRQSLEAAGLGVRTGVTVASVPGDSPVSGVTLTDGTTLPADLVVFACGVRPRVELAESAGLPVARGILVDDRMATAVPGVWAVGECVEHRGRVYGLVQPAWEQAEVLARALCGDATAAYTGTQTYTRLKVAGVQVASMGRVEPECDSDEVVQVIETRRGLYRKLVLRDGRLAGAVLVGEGTAEDAASLIQMFDRGDELPDNRLEVFCPGVGGPAGTSAGDPEVCNCNHVRESVVLKAIADGCTSLPCLAERTRAGTGCGSCRGQLSDLLMRAGAPA